MDTSRRGWEGGKKGKEEKKPQTVNKREKMTLIHGSLRVYLFKPCTAHNPYEIFEGVYHSWIRYLFMYFCFELLTVKTGSKRPQVLWNLAIIDKALLTWAAQHINFALYSQPKL
jgi:hypothetical protein